MRHADAIGFDVSGELGEVAVAQVSGSHLDTHLVLFGIGEGIEVDAMQADAFTLAEIYAELFVALAFFATQVEVAVGCMDGHPQVLENQEQSHTVCSSREGYNIRTVVLPHSVAHDIVSDYRFYLVHILYS